jgi:PKD repeat protein
MKKALFSILGVIGLIQTLPATIITNPSSGTAYVGQSIGVQVDCLQNCPCLMMWGDGTTTSGNDNDFFVTFKNHVYRDPGTYSLHFRRYPTFTPICPQDEYKTVSIVENRSIAVSPSPPCAGLPLTFTAVNFNTPDNIMWDMGDGNVYIRRNTIITHTYSTVGTYTVRAYDWDGSTRTIPVTLVLNLTRNISFSPAAPRVDEPVEIRANGFSSGSIDWNFGDGSPQQTYSAAVSHRYQNPGVFVITALEHGSEGAPATRAIAILPENRFLSLSTQELRAGEPLTVTANNFRSPLILWDFGDGTVLSGPPVMTHAYKLPGNYAITARDENGTSEKRIQASVRILGISDQVNLEVAELTLDNGKYYKVVPKNSKDIAAQLKMKMRGTGIVSGYWIVDNQPYQFFNETVFQGQLKTIITPEIPGLPVFDPGMHTVTVQLTRPAAEAVVFQTLRYFVLPYENMITILSPRDGAVIKEDQVANFSWQSALGGSYYQIAFANSLFPILREEAGLVWLDCPERLNFTPDAQVWQAIGRNQWSYWKVRALDSNHAVVAESPVQEIKLIITGAEIGIQRISDMDGNGIALGGDFTTSRNDQLLIRGQLSYPGEAEFLILRVYANDQLVDQLLFRDLKKDERRTFETSVPNLEKESRVIFEVLKSSSPSLVIGYAELKLKKQ